jgi:hypothetical protein
VREAMKKNSIFIALGVTLLLLGGCATEILKQDIPVSTDPIGAKIYADGRFTGQTPTTVSLERTKDHILTLVKENYRQEDVVVRRQYQQDKVLMKAVHSGINSGLFFKDARMGVNSGMSAISRQEESGEAYILVPPVVKMTLTPLFGPSSGTPGGPLLPTPPAPGSAVPVVPETAPVDQRALTKDLLKTGAEAAASQMKPVQKTWETSSSSSTRTYTSPDGSQQVTRTKKSSTSVGVGFNPAGMVDVIDTLFK